MLKKMIWTSLIKTSLAQRYRLQTHLPQKKRMLTKKTRDRARPSLALA
jgi:hypothetical protein